MEQSLTRLTNDLVVLTGSVVAFPTMQLTVRLGRFDLEMNGVQMVDIYHDPFLSKESLFMPESESPYYIEPSVPPVEPRSIPFFSKLRTKVYSFGFSPRSEDRRLIYSAAAYDRESAKLMALALTRRLNGEAAARPYEVLHMLVFAIGLLTDWPLEIGLKNHWEMIELRIGAGLVAAIEDVSGLSLPIVTDRECLLAQLPIATQSTDVR